jgi:hypothetical protein
LQNERDKNFKQDFKSFEFASNGELTESPQGFFAAVL